MKISLNGKEKEIQDGISITQLLKEESVKMPEMVSVEYNNEMLDRSQFESTIIKENDQIEFLYFMGGG